MTPSLTSALVFVSASWAKLMGKLEMVALFTGCPWTVASVRHGHPRAHRSRT